MDDPKSQVAFKAFVIAVAVKQDVTTLYAEGGDHAVDGLANRNAFDAERAIVHG